MNQSNRPLHNVYGELNFIYVRFENKNCAKCCFCEVIVKNTANEFPKAHKIICRRRKVQEPTFSECLHSTLDMSVEETVDEPLEQEDRETITCSSTPHADLESTAIHPAK